MRFNRLIAFAGLLLLPIAARANAPLSPTATQVHYTSATITWGDNGGALGFVVEASTGADFSGPPVSSKTVGMGITTATLTNLQSNATYFARVGSVYSSSYSYTLLGSTLIMNSVPFPATINATPISATSIQWSWSLISGATNYHLYDNSIPPVLISTSAGSAYVETGLQASTNYTRMLRAIVRGVPSPFSSPNTASTLSVSSGSSGGQGVVTLTSSTVAEGDIATSTLTFRVGASGLTAGGKVSITLPSGWPIPQTVNNTVNNYVALTATGSFSSTLLYESADNALVFTLSSGFLNAGHELTFTFHRFFVGCSAAANGALAWTVKSKQATAGTLMPIAVQPAQTYITGPARYLRFEPGYTLTVAPGQVSGVITLQSVNYCQRPVAVSGNTPIELKAYLSDYFTPDSAGEFSQSPNFTTTLSTLTLSNGSSSTHFYYRTSTAGGNFKVLLASYTVPASPPQQAYRSVSVLAAAATFSDLSVDAGVRVANQASTTLSPDGDGVNEFGYVRFTPSLSTLQWRVRISTDASFNNWVFERWGVGDPQGGVNWDGRNYYAFGGGVVPNGTYFVRVEYPGLLVNDTLSFTMNTGSISGSVLLGGSPAPDARVNAYVQNGGTGYGEARTDGSGNYVMYGLRSGVTYGVSAEYYSTTSAALVQDRVNNVSVGGTANFNFSTPGRLRVAAFASAVSPITSFGNVNVRTADYSKFYGANLRLEAGSQTSDNGDLFNLSTWTVLGLPPGSYVMEVSMPGYGKTSKSITITANNTVDEIVNLVPKATVYGRITLPSAATQGVWVSVEGTQLGRNLPTVWGGVYINSGQSDGIYTVVSVDAGTWTFRARPPMYQPLDLSLTVGSSNIGNSSTGGADFSGFTTGGTISGNITISGSLSNLSYPSVGISANSQALGLNAYTSVSFSTASTPATVAYTITGLANGTYQVFPYLSGFESTPPGPVTVTVSGGVGTRNLSLTRVSGQIQGTITLPGSANDYSQIHLSLRGNSGSGDSNREIDLSSGPSFSISNLPSGYYTLSATYRTTGASKEVNLSVTNGLSSTADLDLSAATYNVSGTVSIPSEFTMQTSTGAVVTVNTVAGLLAAATQQVIILGGSQNYSTATGGCSGGTAIAVSAVRVEAFQKDFTYYGNNNRDGFSNCFAYGRYRYASISSTGAYALEGLTPGVWEISVYPYFDGGRTPTVSIEKKTLTISGTRTGVDFSLGNGNTVSGTVSLPAGDSDVKTFDVSMQTAKGETVQTNTLTIGSVGSPASSASFEFKNLADGDYSLILTERGEADSYFGQAAKYVAKPKGFTVKGAAVTGLTITLARSSRIVGRLAIQGKNPDGTSALTLITANNISLLPSGFGISAEAFPWVEGGYQSAAYSGSSVDINSENQFHIDGLVEGVYDVNFRQNSYGFSVGGSGGVNIANQTKAQIKVTQGQTLDLGTITLIPGLSVGGTVRDTSGNALPNIRVRAYPSINDRGSNGLEAITNSAGQYTLLGLDASLKNYDIQAAPRPEGSDNTPAVPYGSFTRRAVNITETTSVDFSLSAANASLSGTILTEDNGPLSYPDEDRGGYPAAAIYMRALNGPTQDDDPLGDIREATALDGTFAIRNLVPGTYVVQVVSLGYRPKRLTLTVDGATSAGSITLQKGPRLMATLTKPDGSGVNTTDTRQAVAVTADLNSIIFGQIASDQNTRNIRSIQFDGFELNKTYSILIFDSLDNIMQPSEGRSISFTDNSQSQSIGLTYKQGTPSALANVRKSGSGVVVSFFFTRPLRNTQAFDEDPDNFVTLTSGAGTLSEASLSGDRRSMSIVYTPTATETTATLDFLAYTTDVDPSTGESISIAKTAVLRFGQKAAAEKNINPVLGGEVSLATSNDPSNVSLPANSLRTSTGSAVNADTSYNVSFTATDDVSSAGLNGARVGGISLSAALTRGAQAYVDEAYAAMQSLKAAAALRTTAINPFSAFYSVLLPAGISHTLNQNATLTLQYSSDADPDEINVYYFDGTRYLIEKANRIVDTVNRTISVQVNHFSTFVVLQNSQSVVTVNGGASAASDIQVYNFPNPFDLNSKTKTLTDGGTTGSLTTDGTIIRYSFPASLAGAVQLDIYNVVGEKVRSIALGTPAAATVHYVAWDGKNDDGRKVASGVYIGVLKVGGEKRTWKMAVIK